MTPFEVTTVADARAGLSQILRTFRTSPRAAPVVLGSHRTPEAVLVPYGQFRAPDGPLLESLHAKRTLISRLASLSHIQSVAVFGSVARGTETADSDIDLLVDTCPGASLFDLNQFAIDLEQIFDRAVDVVSRASLIAGPDDEIFASAVAL